MGHQISLEEQDQICLSALETSGMVYSKWAKRVNKHCCHLCPYLYCVHLESCAGVYALTFWIENVNMHACVSVFKMLFIHLLYFRPNFKLPHPS